MALLQDEQATARDVMVYAVLASHADRNRQCWPSIRTIADEARMTNRTVIRALEWLEEAWYISRTTRNTGRGRTSNLYTLHDGQIVALPTRDDTPPAG